MLGAVTPFVLVNPTEVTAPVVLEPSVSGEPIVDGQSVTVYIDEDGWTLDEASTRELVEAMAECDRGEVVTAEEVFA